MPHEGNHKYYLITSIKIKFFILIFIILDSTIVFSAEPLPVKDNLSLNWYGEAQASLHYKLKTMQQNIAEARNVIIFLGDGMSIPTITASRILSEQIFKGSYGLEIDRLPYSGLSKTYCADSQVADSACSATAYLGGVKANYGTIGVTDDVELFDCKAAANLENQVSSIATWAQDAGKLTGIVTTTRVTHASPAGNYAHIAHRDMESDLDIYEMINSTNKVLDYCRDIATQIMRDAPGKNFNVIMGGGRNKFLPYSENQNSKSSSGGYRLDGLDLIKEWRVNHKKNKTKYVSTRKELLNVNFTETEFLLGLFAESHMKYNLDNTNKKEPSLAEMTEAAIKILDKNEQKGYYLFVEGGRIDFAHHKTKARKALDETIEFSKAIEVAKKITSSNDTLIVITADHSHTMSISGYSPREQDILGLNYENSDIDKLPYTTLNYASGPDTKRRSHGKRKNLTNDDLSDANYKYPSSIPITLETHGGDDVAVFASGPQSHLFSGVYEQHLIPHLIGYAACIGRGYTFCDKKQENENLNNF